MKTSQLAFLMSAVYLSPNLPVWLANLCGIACFVAAIMLRGEE